MIVTGGDRECMCSCHAPWVKRSEQKPLPPQLDLGLRFNKEECARLCKIQRYPWNDCIPANEDELDGLVFLVYKIRCKSKKGCCD